MKISKLFFAVLLLTNFYYAQTTVSGEQSGVWTKQNSPYLVEGEITVPNGSALQIESGVQVIFQGHFKFNVNGTLIANGTETDSVIFTASNTDEGWGGIRFNNSGGNILKYCVLEYGKTSAADYPDNNGGAVALINSNAKFYNCLFQNNNAPGDEDGMGGAVYGINTGGEPGATRFVNCVFENNYAYGEGGAIKFSGDLSSVIDSCVFINNHCQYGGGALSLYSVYKTKILNSVFANNYTSYSAGGAIQGLGYGNLFYVGNSTFYGNHADGGDGGGIYLAYTQMYMANSIVKNNHGAYSNDVYLDFEASAEINYSDIQLPEGATGSNNINADPQFIDAQNLDFHLTAHSPCVDAGTNFYAVGSDTIVYIESFYGQAPDIGAYEFYPPGAVTLDKPGNFELYQNYPNPFNPTTNITYVIARSEATRQSAENSALANNATDCHASLRSARNDGIIQVSLKVYDALGREVATLVNEKQAPGKYSVQFENSNFPSGIYFYTLRAGNFVQTRKMVLMK